MSVLLQMSNLTKSYAAKPLFSDLSFTVTSNQHIAVIGRNGAGKSTLFKIIMEQEKADAGDVQILDHTHIGYIRQQEHPFALSETVIAFLQRSSGKEPWECATVAAQFDIKNEQLEQTIGSFAGGYQMRIQLIAMLLEEPNLLLLDEPTNYLDLSTLLLLEQFLQSFSGSFLLISHDREFLKRTCTETLEIAQGKANFFPGPLEDYLEHKIQQEEFARRYNKKIARQQRHLQTFVDRFRSKASKASQAQSKLKQIARLEQITIDHPIQTARIVLPKLPGKKGVALRIRNLSIGYPEKTVAEGISLHIDRGEHVAIVGNNGQGKSTLLKTIVGVIPPKEGSFKFAKGLQIGYYAQHVPDMLDGSDQVQDYLNHIAGPHASDQDIYQMAGNFLFKDDDLKKSISVLSGGEKSRLCLAGLLLQGHDMLLLDEPSNHLDVETVEALSTALAETHMTLLFVSHNRTFVQEVATSIIEVADGRVIRSLHDYENYVYHLKEELDIKQSAPIKNKTTDAMKQERIQVRSKLKEAKRELHEVEVDVMHLEKRKQDLLNWFEEHPNTFSRIKQDTLRETEKILHDQEQAWLELGQRVHNLEGELQSLQENNSK